ncbi:hypothetical protein MMC14_002103 [Varicellaria rhodocarpa]|nr:hypothetical protein [Varicellaria rhodocarpa]
MLPSIRQMELQQAPWTQTFHLGTILERIAVSSSSSPKENLPLGNLSKVKVWMVSRHVLFPLLALPSIRSLEITHEIWGDEPAWAADLPLSNLTDLDLGDWLPIKELSSLLARIKALRSFRYPWFPEHPYPACRGLNRVLFEHTRHSLERLRIRSDSQCNPRITFSCLHQFLRLKEIDISYHFLAIGQDIRFADSLPHAIEKLTLDTKGSLSFPTECEFLTEIAPILMGMLETMIEDKAMRGRLPNLRKLSFNLDKIVGLQMNLNEEICFAFKNACTAVGVSCEGLDWK